MNCLIQLWHWLSSRARLLRPETNRLEKPRRRAPLSRREQRVLKTMLREGRSIDDVASTLACHRATVYRWRKLLGLEQEHAA